MRTQILCITMAAILAAPGARALPPDPAPQIQLSLPLKAATKVSYGAPIISPGCHRQASWRP